MRTITRGGRWWAALIAALGAAQALIACSGGALQDTSSVDQHHKLITVQDAGQQTDYLRELLAEGHIPYRGPFRLPDGRALIGRGLPHPLQQLNRSASSLPPIWGVDGRAAGPTGPVKLVVAKVTFSDFSGNEINRTDLEDWFFNTEEGPVLDSVAEYYHRESYGELQVSGIVLPETGSYELDGSVVEFMFPMYPPSYAAMWSSLVSQIDDDVDGAEFDGNNDGAVDAIVVVPPYGDPMQMGQPIAFVSNHAQMGYYSGDIDDKAVETNSFMCNCFDDTVNRHAVPRHEFGHILGLPDLYDGGGMGPPTNGPDEDEGRGAGGWALMSQSGHLSHNLPMCAPMKLLLGWDGPVDLSTEPGINEYVHLLYANEEPGQMRRIVLGGGNMSIGGANVPWSEFIVLEARSLMPPGTVEDGLLVWHVNEKVYLEKVLSGSQPELPNSDEEYKYIDLVETPHDADDLVDRPYVQGNPDSLARASDVWPYSQFNSLSATVPTTGDYPYKQPSLLPAMPTAPYFDASGPETEVTDIARMDPGISFTFTTPEPLPPELTSFTPLVTSTGSGVDRRCYLSANVAGNQAGLTMTVTVSYMDAEGEQQKLVRDASDGTMDTIDVTGLMPNQRVTLGAVAEIGELISEPLMAEADVVTLIGDVDCDDVLADGDAAALLALFGWTSSNEDFRPWHDPNGDGVVDERDLAYIGYFFGRIRPAS